MFVLTPHQTVGRCMTSRCILHKQHQQSKKTKKNDPMGDSGFTVVKNDRIMIWENKLFMALFMIHCPLVCEV